MNRQLSNARTNRLFFFFFSDWSSDSECNHTDTFDLHIPVSSLTCQTDLLVTFIICEESWTVFFDAFQLDESISALVAQVWMSFSSLLPFHLVISLFKSVIQDSFILWQASEGNEVIFVEFFPRNTPPLPRWTSQRRWVCVASRTMLA